MLSTATKLRICICTIATTIAIGGCYWLWINRYDMLAEVVRISDETEIDQTDGYYYFVSGPGDIQAVFRRGIESPIVGPNVYEAKVVDGVLLVAQRPLKVEFINDQNRELGDCRIVAINVATGEQTASHDVPGKVSCGR